MSLLSKTAHFPLRGKGVVVIQALVFMPILSFSVLVTLGR